MQLLLVPMIMAGHKAAKSLILLAIIIQIRAAPICVQETSVSGASVVCTAHSDQTIRRGLLSNNNRTTEVIMKKCHVTNIDVGAFDALPSLENLDLSHNTINALNELFEETPNMKRLNLSDNQIAVIKPKVFHPIPKLNTLDMSDNVISGRNLDAATFHHSVAIEYLDFSGNSMTGTQEDLLQALQMIKTLNLNRCLLQAIPSFATRANLNTMTRLELSFNQIARLHDPRTFASLSNLEYLDLAGNLVEFIHEDVLKPLKNLKVVLLQYNKIAHLPETTFTGLTKLGNIDLSHNLIEYVPVNAFRNTKLKNLNLSDNKFTYLQDNFCLELRNSGVMMKKFFFNQNPWQCACLLDALKEVKKFRIEYNMAKYRGKERVCVTSREFHCKRHLNFNDEYVEMYNDLNQK